MPGWGRNRHRCGTYARVIRHLNKPHVMAPAERQVGVTEPLGGTSVTPAGLLKETRHEYFLRDRPSTSYLCTGWTLLEMG